MGDAPFDAFDDRRRGNMAPKIDADELTIEVESDGESNGESNV